MSKPNLDKNDRICAYPECKNLGRSKGGKTKQRGKWCYSHHTKWREARLAQAEADK